MLCTSMMHNDDVMAADKSVKLNPAKSVLKHEVGDPIALSEADFTRLSEVFIAEIAKKYP